ncbi:MAG: hypothetical protein B6D59_03500 [Campylobacteraceae bacterium 4484_4]|nr:MAG: hypothetical protein B6D59_03500 [Campylobacteraceae bacterium 4484_4]
MESAAKRYTPDTEKSTPFYIKGILLYILPFPFLLALFFALIGGDISAILSNGLTYGLFLLAATIARRGFLNERHYNRSKIAKAPKLPYKTAAAMLLAVATFSGSFFAASNSLLLSLLLSGVTFGGFALYYGLDPRRDKLPDLGIGVSAEELLEITGRARERVAHLKKLRQGIPAEQIRSLLGQIITETEEVIDAVEENPGDLGRARKFFNVYLYRTEQITQEYQKSLKKEIVDEKMRRNYHSLLERLLETIREQKERLNEEDWTKLDVQIEALTKQLKIEGV